MLTTASKDEAGNGIDWASPHTNAKPGASRCRLHKFTRFRGEVHPRHRAWLQVAAYVGGASTSSRPHLQDILVTQITVADRMAVELDAQPIPFIRRPQRWRSEIYRRGSIAIVHERPVRRRHTLRQGPITGSPHQSPDGHRPKYRSVEPTLGEPTAPRLGRTSPKPSSRLFTE